MELIKYIINIMLNLAKVCVLSLSVLFTCKQKQLTLQIIKHM